MIDPLNYSDANWKRVYDRLLQAAETYGSVELASKSDDYRTLMLWRARQMRAYALNQLTAEQEILLEQVPGWIWSITDDYGTQKLRTRELDRFVRRHGRVPSLHIRSEMMLAMWMIEQRRNFDSLAGTPIGHELSLIPGFLLPAFQSQLAREVDEYIRWMDANGRAPRNFRHARVEYGLYRWARDVKQRWSRGKMSMLDFLEIERIPGWTWPIVDAETAAPHEAERPDLVAA